jgi:hypothetical protein
MKTVENFAGKTCEKGITPRIPPHYFSKIWFSYIKAFGLNSLEKSGEFKLLSLIQILLVAAKRLDFCQLISKSTFRFTKYSFSIIVPYYN